MPGNAKTNGFLLSTATVCVGPMADVYNLNPTAHSVGLVKNVQAVSEPTFVELTQGVKNQPVMTVPNSDGLRVSFEVYEYTLRNLGYAAGLDASGAGFNALPNIHTTAAVVNAAATSLTVATDLTLTYPIGSWIYLQNGLDDYIHVAKVSAVSYSNPNTTITFTGFAIPAGLTFPLGSRLGKVVPIDKGAALPQPDLSAKILGVMPKDNRPVVIVYPKIRITKGFSINFQSDAFASMPWEFTPYPLVSGDTFYSDFGDAQFRMFPAPF
jgi:hypothetical protein